MFHSIAVAARAAAASAASAPTAVAAGAPGSGSARAEAAGAEAEAEAEPRNANPTCAAASVTATAETLTPAAAPAAAAAAAAATTPIMDEWNELYTSKELFLVEQRGYEIADLLGQGAFSVVVRAVEKSTRTTYAVKVVSLEADAVQHEVAIWALLKHVNIVQLHAHFPSPRFMFMVLEYVPAGELFDHIVSRKFYSEMDARFLMRQILSALEHMHSRGICHRDLKPENLLCVIQPANDALGDSIQHVKISDFGLAERFVRNQPHAMSRRCGTPGYVAPEVLRGHGYNEKVDLWSIGVILYILLVGFPPFYDKSDRELLRKCEAGVYSFPSPQWDLITPAAKDLIENLMQIDVAKRFSASDSMRHEWIALPHRPSSDHLESTLTELRRFNARRKFMAAAHAVRFGSALLRTVQSTVDSLFSSETSPPIQQPESSTSGPSQAGNNGSSAKLALRALGAFAPKGGLKRNASTTELAAVAPSVVVTTESHETKRVRLQSESLSVAPYFSMADRTLSAELPAGSNVDYAVIGQVLLRMASEGLQKAVVHAQACPDEISLQLPSLFPSFDVRIQLPGSPQ
ncbi:protein kinase domain-containing protein [Capsaspora owczarzaki ATCC 30864]|uniref:CAMK protein kinase n=1 Tax=Capsaspora owczarzaki (strain ATCC 30864) TaxID=595528 RepID=A0A0D2WTC6_CAPO3|nr:protein kinase domain-containing protein [Capsaspora owczarzaki ATCC 30864]KJE94888.1 CAMK protein kinase [Capsaspora owczarzaki ATCC 30864]|eukprot:XP_004346120.2 protein kinase domain-containing protein [Capsaspora owczarzaki ATCC 30864]